MKPNTHAMSSVRQFGGSIKDYEEIHMEQYKHLISKMFRRKPRTEYLPMDFLGFTFDKVLKNGNLKFNHEYVCLEGISPVEMKGTLTISEEDFKSLYEEYKEDNENII